MEPLTPKQQLVLEFVASRLGENHPPSQREIADHFGLAQNAAYQLVRYLRRKGYVVDAGGHRGLRLSPEYLQEVEATQGVPVLGRVAAGVPMPLHAGESEDTRFQCRDLVVDGKIKYCSFDATRAGGVTEWLKIAAFCEVHNVLMAPHCQPQVHAHLLAAIPNGTMVEVHPDEVRHPLWAHGYVDRGVTKDNMFYLTKKPGFGVEIAPDYLAEFGTKLA